MDIDRRRAAIEVTAERMNAERAAMGLPPGYGLKFNADGVPWLGCIGEDVATPTIKRVRLPPAAEPVRVRLKR